jgi:hypothetical protein
MGPREDFAFPRGKRPADTDAPEFRPHPPHGRPAGLDYRFAFQAVIVMHHGVV